MLDRLLFLVVSFLLHTQCYDNQPKIINVCMLMPITGSVSGSITPRILGAKKCVNDLNEQKFLGDFTMLNFSYYDTENTLFGAINTTYNMLEDCCSKTLCVVIGSSPSSESHKIASILDVHNILQVSPTSSSSLLSYKVLYPTFARVVPNDNLQGEAAVALMEYIGWNRIAMVYSYDIYGYYGNADFITATWDKNLTVKSFPVQDDDLIDGVELNQLFESLRNYSPEVIYLMMPYPLAHDVLLQCRNLSNVTWILSDSASQRELYYINNGTDLDEQVASVLVKSLATIASGGSGEVHDKFKEWWKEFNTQDVNLYAYYSYDAVLAAAYALKSLIDKQQLFTNTSGNEIWNELINTNFSGATGPVSFDENGDRLTTNGLEIFVILKFNGIDYEPSLYWDGTTIQIITPPSLSLLDTLLVTILGGSFIIGVGVSIILLVFYNDKREPDLEIHGTFRYYFKMNGNGWERIPYIHRKHGYWKPLEENEKHWHKMDKLLLRLLEKTTKIQIIKAHAVYNRCLIMKFNKEVKEDRKKYGHQIRSGSDIIPVVLIDEENNLLEKASGDTLEGDTMLEVINDDTLVGDTLVGDTLLEDINHHDFLLVCLKMKGLSNVVPVFLIELKR